MRKITFSVLALWIMVGLFSVEISAQGFRGGGGAARSGGGAARGGDGLCGDDGGTADRQHDPRHGLDLGQRQGRVERRDHGGEEDSMDP